LPLIAILGLLLGAAHVAPSRAETQTAAIDATAEAAVTTTDTADSDAPTLLTEDELEVLVARIALYPDDLVAVVIASALYPIQIVEAERFLTDKESKPDLKPSDKWDGSVVSLLNYPDIVKMMSDDLGWTQQLGDAAVNQQKDVLVAIQQLRDEAVAKGVLKSDDKVEVKEESDNVVIASKDPQVVYVPTYPPEMFYVPGYVWPASIFYGPAYPSYFYPGAPYWAGFVTGAIWGAALDWNRWHAYGGNINIDVNRINNRFDVDFDKIDVNKLKNIDRNKLKNIDRSKLDMKNFDHDKLKDNLRKDARNDISNKVKDRPGDRSKLSGGGTHGDDIRKSVQQGLKDPGNRRPSGGEHARLEPGGKAGDLSKGHDRPSGKAGAKHDTRAKQPSALGEPKKGKVAQNHSSRGAASRGGGYHGGTPRHNSIASAHHGGGAVGRGGGGGGGIRRR
jgi:hypothetical protein